MNKSQLQQIIDYIDAEFAGIVSRMSQEDRAARLQHFAREIGSLDFDDAMLAVKKLSRGQYMPRTAEILAEVEQIRKTQTSGKEKVRIFRDASGNEILSVTRDGETVISGYLASFPDWMQAKFRWLSTGDPTEWDAYIMAHEERACADALMTMGGAA